MKERSYCRRWNKCLRQNIFPTQPFPSRWPGVTRTMHTMLVDEKTRDLSPLFMDARNSKVPLSALLNALVHWHFMQRPEPYLDVVKWQQCYAEPGTLALALQCVVSKIGRAAYKVVLAPTVPHCTVVSQIRCWWNGLILTLESGVEPL